MKIYHGDSKEIMGFWEHDSETLTHRFPPKKVLFKFY